MAISTEMNYKAQASAVNGANVQANASGSSQTVKPEQFSRITKLFQENKGTLVTSNCRYLKDGDTHFFGIHRNNQMQGAESNASAIAKTRKLYLELKGIVLQTLGLDTTKKVVQVVGDSSPFSLEGTIKAKDFLEKELCSQKERAAVLYGYTGHAKTEGLRCVNSAVSDIMQKNGMLDQTIANLVAYHSPLALSKWGCSGADLKTYVLVYGDDESSEKTGSLFGADIVTSDYFADQLLMLCGGAQSFSQACNSLLLDQQIHVLGDLRPEDRKIYFDSAKFFKDLKSFMDKQGANLTEAALNDWYKAYFSPTTCILADPAKPDYATKQKLFDNAWKSFIENKLYLKLNLMTFS